MRPRLSGEVQPVSGEIHSDTVDPDTAASKAFDMNLETNSLSGIAPDGTQWLKLKLEKELCVERVGKFHLSGVFKQDWTCTREGCSQCVGQNCHLYTLTVYKEGGEDGEGSLECKLGDTVKLERVEVNNEGFKVNEIAVFAQPRQGKARIKYDCVTVISSQAVTLWF